MYHLQNLPPACLLHGVDDPYGLAVRTGELSPFSQSVELAEEKERRGLEPYWELLREQAADSYQPVCRLMDRLRAIWGIVVEPAEADLSVWLLLSSRRRYNGLLRVFWCSRGSARWEAMNDGARNDDDRGVGRKPPAVAGIPGLP
jgi:hypothetical protein